MVRYSRITVRMWMERLVRWNMGGIKQHNTVVILERKIKLNKYEYKVQAFNFETLRNENNDAVNKKKNIPSLSLER